MADPPITYEQLFDTLRREKSREELQKLDHDFYEKVRAFLSIKQDIITQESANGLHSLAVQRASIEYQNAKKILKELYERRERKIITLSMHRTRTDAAVIDGDALLPEEQGFLEQLVHLMLQNRERTLSAAEARSAMVVTPGFAFQERTMPRYDEPSLPSSSSSPSSDDDAADDATRQTREEETTHERPIGTAAAVTGDPELADGDTFSSVEETQLSVRFVAPVPKFVGKDLRVFGPYEPGMTATLPDDVARILVKKGRAQEIFDEE